MALKLRPLFENDTKKQRFDAIDDNLSSIGGAIYSSESLIVDDYVRQLEHATTINDEETRNAFLDVARSLKYAKERMLEASEGIKCVQRQLKSMINEDGKVAAFIREVAAK